MIYLFNPDNDLALANFSAHYTPPASAAKIAEDLAALPLWYAPEGARIIASGTENRRFGESVKEIFGIQSALISVSEISDFRQEKIIPWGWNPALRKKMLELNVPEANMPSQTGLLLLRTYSGRQNAVKMLRELKQENDGYCGESHFFTTVEDVLDFLSLRKGDKALKMPNSGSGKGLLWIFGNITEKQTDWCKRVVKMQGGVVAEPVFCKKQDFAMEFYMQNGHAVFVGYSLFNSAASGAYAGNRLLSDAAIENELGVYANTNMLHRLRSALTAKLPRYFPLYSGYLGVDMMICETEKGYQIHPCVEINMRMNMGLVAHIFYNRFVKAGSTGKFVVDFFKKQEEAFKHQQQTQRGFPLIVENGKIVSGFLSLTPVTEQTHYAAWVLIEK